jgi:hypothetical protein
VKESLKRENILVFGAKPETHVLTEAYRIEEKHEEHDHKRPEIPEKNVI